MVDSPMALTTLGGGCFWCIEAVFLETKGIEKIISGYAGGSTDNPTYKEICTGTSGHAEVVQLEFDEGLIDFKTILEVFFTVHNPTTLNRQGNDVGTQYRSVIFYHDDEQKKIAEEVMKEVATQIWDKPIVTELSPLPKFYAAEDYHQNYYELNPSNPYCSFVITPKIQKFRQKFSNLRK